MRSITLVVAFMPPFVGACKEDSIFRLMSMTKPVIALAALTLCDNGRFSLDEPIAKHCPEWAAPRVKDGGAIVPATAAITPRMLMSHSSGLGYGGGRAAAASCPPHSSTGLTATRMVS